MKWTNQTLMDHNYKYFIVDKNTPGFNGGGCDYDAKRAGRRGGRCAIGCAMSEEKLDALYNTSAKNRTIDDCLSEIPIIFDEFDQCDVDFLMSMQRSHDNAASIGSTDEFREEFTTNLKRICVKYSLIYPGDQA